MAISNPLDGVFEVIVERAVFFVRLGNMRGHVGQHVTHMIVGDIVKDLPAMPDAAHQSRRLEQA